MRKHRLALFFVAVLAVFCAKAHNVAGEEVCYLVTDTQVEIPMEEVGFLLAADDDTYFSVVTQDSHIYKGVTRATFEKRTTVGVAQVNAQGQLAVYPTVSHSSLTVSGCQQGEQISVVSLAGQVCIVTEAADGGATVDVSALQPGAYLLNVGGMTVKFIKR